MPGGRLRRACGLGLLLLALLAAGGSTAITASNSVPSTNASSLQSDATSWNQVAGSQCGTGALAAMLTGTGNLSGGTASELMLGGPAGQTLDGGGGDDCILGAGGDDSLRGSQGIDICIGGPGVDTFHPSCETTVQ